MKNYNLEVITNNIYLISPDNINWLSTIRDKEIRYNIAVEVLTNDWGIDELEDNEKLLYFHLTPTIDSFSKERIENITQMSGTDLKHFGYLDIYDEGGFIMIDLSTLRLDNEDKFRIEMSGIITQDDVETYLKEKIIPEINIKKDFIEEVLSDQKNIAGNTGYDFIESSVFGTFMN